MTTRRDQEATGAETNPRVGLPPPPPPAPGAATAVAGRCASTSEVAARYPQVTAERAAYGLEAMAALPLRAGARIIGSLGLSFTAERRFTVEDLAFLGALADLCARARRARLYEMERQAHTRAACAGATPSSPWPRTNSRPR